MLTIVGATVVVALAAAALTGWIRRVAETESRWLRSALHVPLAGLGAAGAAVTARGWAELLAWCALALAAALLVVIDLAAYRLPDVIVGPMYPILFVLLAAAAATSGDWGRLGRAALAGLIVITVYFVLALIAPSGLGLGDVKLSGLLGAFLGWFGWPHVVLGVLAGFALNAVVALTLLAVTRLTRHGAVPFGPCMMAGAVVGAVWGLVVFPGIGG
ncbi:prepilin peptidase [Cumulibacter manganitolerans]|uniref:prepilin peptidase n=1 Tax=Cumulibacter manganitolerans TaxID=1884992 RepID=UPI0012977FFE|nr:A24 family peptidase [Cumulibacter manganitolerans]